GNAAFLQAQTGLVDGGLHEFVHTVSSFYLYSGLIQISMRQYLNDQATAAAPPEPPAACCRPVNSSNNRRYVSACSKGAKCPQGSSVYWALGIASASPRA